MAAELKWKQECKSKWLIEGTQLAESNPSRSDHSPLLTPTHPYSPLLTPTHPYAPFFFFAKTRYFHQQFWMHQVTFESLADRSVSSSQQLRLLQFPKFFAVS